MLVHQQQLTAATSQHNPWAGIDPRLWPSGTTYSGAEPPPPRVHVCASTRRKEETRRMCLTGRNEIKSGDFPVDCSALGSCLLLFMVNMSLFISNVYLFIFFNYYYILSRSLTHLSQPLANSSRSFELAILSHLTLFSVCSFRHIRASHSAQHEASNRQCKSIDVYTLTVVPLYATI